MKTIEEIRVRVIELSAEQAGVAPAEVTVEHDFYADLNFDSLDITEFAMNVEDEFGVTFPDEAIENVRKVSNAIDLVWEQTKQQEQATATSGSSPS